MHVGSIATPIFKLLIWFVASEFKILFLQCNIAEKKESFSL